MRKLLSSFAGTLLILTTLSSLSARAAAVPLIFPHYVQGGGYQTTFTFNNLSPTATEVTLDLYSQSGGLTESVSVPLPGLGSGTYTLSGTVLTIGWARADFAGPADVAGTETIQMANGTGGLSMEASVFAAQPDTVLRVPVYEKDGLRTGIALVNLSPIPSTVSLILHRDDGAADDAATMSLDGGQQTTCFVSELFPALSDFEGMLEISNPRPLAGLALRVHEATGIFSPVPVSPQSPEPYFSPDGGISSRIVQEIERAQSSIDIEIYTFTRTEIMNALIAARARGVAIRILADNSEAAAPGSVIPRLLAAGIPVKRTDGGGGGIMHNKVAVFDRQVLLTGSYNWSTAAEESNDENAVFIRTPSLVAAYQSAFDNLWLTR
jgi:hypothetical protein